MATRTRKLSPADRPSSRPSSLTYVVEGFTVLEVATGPFPRKDVVFRGCDQGSAHTVARALAEYWSNGGRSVPWDSLPERYPVHATQGRADDHPSLGVTDLASTAHHERAEQVLMVTTPIPQLGARPGDELVVRPSDLDFPVVLRRTFDVEMLSAIPTAAVELLGSFPSPEALRSSDPESPGALRLRLVP